MRTLSLSGRGWHVLRFLQHIHFPAALFSLLLFSFHPPIHLCGTPWPGPWRTPLLTHPAPDRSVRHWENQRAVPSTHAANPHLDPVITQSESPRGFRLASYNLDRFHRTKAPSYKTLFHTFLGDQAIVILQRHAGIMNFLPRRSDPSSTSVRSSA
jgi:hypothetical protein